VWTGPPGLNGTTDVIGRFGKASGTASAGANVARKTGAGAIYPRAAPRQSGPLTAVSQFTAPAS
jgi:hypothetical protein